MKVRKDGKYAEIARVIMTAADAGEYLTISEIHQKLPYACAYGSLRKNLDALEEKKMIQRERAGMSVLIKPMLLLYQWFR